MPELVDGGALPGFLNCSKTTSHATSADCTHHVDCYKQRVNTCHHDDPWTQLISSKTNFLELGRLPGGSAIKDTQTSGLESKIHPFDHELCSIKGANRTSMLSSVLMQNRHWRKEYYFSRAPGGRVTLNNFLWRIRLSTREVPENLFLMRISDSEVSGNVQFSGVCMALW